MEICFTKKKEDGHIIYCKRKDGSVTWMKSSSFFVHHDMMHYAVETVLDYKSAFYGMLDGGTSITDFELPKEERNIELTDESILAEHLVNLFLIEYNQGQFGDFQQVLKESFKNQDIKLTAPELSAVQIDKIRIKFTDLAIEWQKLPSEKSIIVNY